MFILNGKNNSNRDIFSRQFLLAKLSSALYLKKNSNSNTSLLFANKWPAMMKSFVMIIKKSGTTVQNSRRFKASQTQKH